MRYVQHHFGVDMAAKYGIPCAILAQEIFYWITRNAAEGRNIHDGRAWMYQTLSGLERLHPYLTRKQIRAALNKLVDEGLVVKGEFNRNPYDRTVWYSLTDEGVSWFTSDSMRVYGAADPVENSDSAIVDNSVLMKETAGRVELPSRARRDALGGTSCCPPGHVEMPQRAHRVALGGTSSIGSINTRINTPIRDAESNRSGTGAMIHDFSRYNFQ